MQFSLHVESSIRACSLLSLPPSQNSALLIQGHVETLEALEDDTCTHSQSVDKDKMAKRWRGREKERDPSLPGLSIHPALTVL